MRQMKNSGIAWVGEIPQEWGIRPVRSIVLERTGGCWGGDINCEEEGEICLRIADFDFYKGRFQDVEITQLTRRKYSFAQIKRCQLKKGDILVEKSGGGEKTPVGRCVMFDKEYTALFANFMDKLRIDCSVVTPLYVEYWLRGWYFCKASPFYINQTTGLQNIDLSLMLAKEKICFPSITYQKRITDYLDIECEKIERIQSDIQAQINTLEQYKRSVITEAVTHGLNHNVTLQESGIAWVGKCPRHWEQIKGKYILSPLYRSVRPNDGVVTCFRDGQVTLRSNRREDGFTMADKEIGYQGIEAGDLVVHGMDGFAGAIGISDSRGKASPVLNVLDTKQNKKYIMYYLRSMAYNNVFTALSTGIRVRSCDLRWNKLAELLYPLPPIDEQEAIVQYIDKQLEKTNAVIANKKSQRDMLDEYKKSLIYEYVTGKKEVVL